MIATIEHHHPPSPLTRRGRSWGARLPLCHTSPPVWAPNVGGGGPPGMGGRLRRRERSAGTGGVAALGACRLAGPGGAAELSNTTGDRLGGWAHPPTRLAPGRLAAAAGEGPAVFFSKEALSSTGSTGSSTSWGGHLKRLLALALPVVAVEVGMVIMAVVDAAMVGHVSAEALGGVALGHTYSWLFMSFGAGTLTVLDPIISQAVGAGDDEAARIGFQRGALLAALLSLPVMAAMCTARPMLTLLGQPAELVPIAGSYSAVCALSVLPFLLFTLLRQTLQAINTVVPLVVASAVANLANVGLNNAFIHGVPAVGMPAMGAVGSAWATVSSRILLFALVLFTARRPLAKIVAPVMEAELRRVQPLKRMAGLGVTLGAQALVEWGAFTATALLMGRLGTVAVAGYQVANSLTDVTYMVPLGISAATSVLVGQSVGRGDAKTAAQVTLVAMLVGAATTASFGAAFCLAPEAIARVWSTSPEVVAMAAGIIPVAGAFQVFDGFRVVAVAVLRGVGLTRVAFGANVLGFWLVGLPLSVLLAFHFGWGAAGLWIGMAGGLAVAAVLCTARIYALFKSGAVERLKL